MGSARDGRRRRRLLEGHENLGRARRSSAATKCLAAARWSTTVRWSMAASSSAAVKCLTATRSLGGAKAFRRRQELRSVAELSEGNKGFRCDNGEKGDKTGGWNAPDLSPPPTYLTGQALESRRREREPPKDKKIHYNGAPKILG